MDKGNYSEQRKRNMQAVRSKGTKLEEKVMSALWKKGIRFRKNVRDLFGNPDIAIKKYKIVIFIDSCFWHKCDIHGTKPKSNVEFWNNKLSRNVQRDKEVNTYYIEKGWNILRVWEHDLKRNDFNRTIEEIVNFIEESKKLS